ncbi:MAG: hypothetical protein KatS3mg038_2250 [Candidatus Kapaibacterium sp.]|nr:MAG: hypothetical protein KatS3mg038_2250 [Candidatus Kapabacteria bacterium]GIV56932.1 MAG: hypothetical protein KatS3mg040_1700 [Candidatus Kapabacteria bacterium]
MEPTLAIYRADRLVVGALVRAGSKGARLDAIGIVRTQEHDHDALEQLKAQLCASCDPIRIALVLDSSDAAVAAFPLEETPSEPVVREQAELEIVQQFLSTPSEGYTAEIYRTCPDIEGRTMGCGVFVLAGQRAIAAQVEEIFGIRPQVTVAALGAAAAFAYNYPEQRAQRAALVTIGMRSVDLAIVWEGQLQWWGWQHPVTGTHVMAVQQLVREAILHCGDISMLVLAGSGAQRTLVEQLVLAYDGRFPHSVGVLDGFRLLECGLPDALCTAAGPLGHVFAPAIGGALLEQYIEPAWRFHVPSNAEMPLQQ